MTTYGLTDAEITAALKARGVGDDCINAWLDSTKRVEVPSPFDMFDSGATFVTQAPTPTQKPDRGGTVPKRATAKHHDARSEASALTRVDRVTERNAEPHRFTLPWALLVSDNLHVGPNANRAKWRTYRERRDAMHAAFADAAEDQAPLDGPCALTVIFYPPNFRRRDVSNFLKALGDALQGVAYYNDDQLVQYVYGRQPPDRAHPRAEITVESIR